MTRRKDSQRGRLYKAEREAFHAFPGLADVASPARYRWNWSGDSPYACVVIVNEPVEVWSAWKDWIRQFEEMP